MEEGTNLSSRRDRMKINDVRKIAKGMDINTYRMKKEEKEKPRTKSLAGF